MPLFFILGAAFYFLPLYYVWKIVDAFRKKRRASAGPAAICLLFWLLQWPVLIYFALGCLGGGCSGNWVSNGLQITAFIVYNAVPAYWLWRRPSTSPEKHE
jgi:hypothetical protein